MTRTLKYGSIALFILNIHLYFYMNDFIAMVNIKIYETLILYLKNEAIILGSQYLIIFNLLISFSFSIAALYFFYVRNYTYIFRFSLIYPIFSLAWFIYSFNTSLYVHIIYLWIPYGITFIMLAIWASFGHIIEQEKCQISLNQTDEAALQNMIHVVNIHDKETGEHIVRTKEYARVLAQYLYCNRLYPDVINPTFINNLYKTAPLHDIGKVGIPDKILKKAGKYTDEEYLIMKAHPTLGREIVMNSIQFYNKNSLLNMAHDIVFCHHERWDGMGYPSQLEGDQIPISGQIMAMADVYDALVSKRRYKESFTYTKADNIILEGRGTAFNPVLVDAFIAVNASLHAISDKYQEAQNI